MDNLVERDTETERQRDRETERQRDRETERQRDRETERQRDRETERQREGRRKIVLLSIQSSLRQAMLHPIPFINKKYLHNMTKAQCYKTFYGRNL